MTLLADIAAAQHAGARLLPCCQTVGIDIRTIQRWRVTAGGDDMRMGPKTTPANKLSAAERARVLAVANSPEYRDMSPKQIVPALADKYEYVASESTFYRVLRDANQLAHRGRAKPSAATPPKERRATGPGQVLSWDITYLRSPVAGVFYYLYLYVDVWSRKILGYRVAERECSDIASQLLRDICKREGFGDGVVVHQDNGAPMKGATFKVTMERLGIIPSFSRPHVSDDNPYSESLFRTMKYRPSYPRKPFDSLDAARAWVEEFIGWYNDEHLHSAIGFVTPAARHEGRGDAILARRRRVYEYARRANPERWTGSTRAWSAPQEVLFNPSKETRAEVKGHAAAA